MTTAHMPLLERLRKGANCVIFLDGAPGPAADVADMLRKAADKIEHQAALLGRADSALDGYQGIGSAALRQSVRDAIKKELGE